MCIYFLKLEGYSNPWLFTDLYNKYCWLFLQRLFTACYCAALLQSLLNNITEADLHRDVRCSLEKIISPLFIISLRRVWCEDNLKKNIFITLFINCFHLFKIIHSNNHIIILLVSMNNKITFDFFLLSISFI